METKNFLGLDGLKRFWEKAKIWIVSQISTKIAEIVAEAPEDLNTLKEISDWISTHEDSASAMNSNIIKNQSDINELNNKLSSMEQTNFKAIFDLVRPVGDTYVQYPQQASPNELWGSFSTWQVVNYDGAFFRAEGTNANAFIEKTDNLVKQTEAIKSHTHPFSWRGTTYGMNRNWFHNHSMYCFMANEAPITNIGNNFGITWNGRKGLWESYVQNGNQIEPRIGTLGVDINHEHYYEGSSTTGSSGSTENRPTNFTIKVWKRTV